MEKRETMGEFLKKARLKARRTPKQLRERILAFYGAEAGESTIRDIENSATPNPGIKTVEYIARANGLDPLQVIALHLDNPPELKPGYTATQFAQLSDVYKRVRKDKKVFADELVRILIENLEQYR